MDHVEILQKMQNGSTLEMYAQTKDEPLAAAFLDGEHVSVTQAFRASHSCHVSKVAQSSNWAAYTWSNQ